MGDTTLDQDEFAKLRTTERSQRVSSKNRDSIISNDPVINPDIKYLSEMAKLQEDALLWNCLKYF